MAKILVLGDTHGNTQEAIFAVQNAVALDIDTIIQCGDFGLWPGKSGMDYLDELNAEAMDNNVTVVWLDGNHEDFDSLERFMQHNPKNTFGQVFIRSNIIYSPRGCKFKLDGKMFMTVGGAVSIDKQWRKPGKSWWPQEQLAEADLDIIIKRHEDSPGKVDYLFTHDCPTNAPFRDRMKNDPESYAHRQRMDRLGKVIQPTLWMHGHMHTKYDGYDFPQYEPTTKVYGLECDGMSWNWGVLDTDDDSFTWGRELEATIFYGEDDPEPEMVEWKDEGWLATVNDNF